VASKYDEISHCPPVHNGASNTTFVEAGGRFQADTNDVALDARHLTPHHGVALDGAHEGSALACP
jgi:hypothetical protein